MVDGVCEMLTLPCAMFSIFGLAKELDVKNIETRKTNHDEMFRVLGKLMISLCSSCFIISRVAIVENHMPGKTGGMDELSGYTYIIVGIFRISVVGDIY